MILTKPKSSDAAKQDIHANSIGFSPYTKVVINKSDLSYDLSGKVIEVSDEENKIFIIGDFISLYHEMEFLNIDAAALLLKDNIDNQEVLEALIVNGVGGFWVVHATAEKVSVYCSVRGPGLFVHEFENVIELYSSEREFFKDHLSDGLDEMQCLHYVISRFSFRAPFNTLIKATRRMIGGQKICVSKAKSEISFYLPINTLCTDKRSDEDALEEFSVITEGLIRQQYEYYKSDRNLFEISGGVDSAMLFCAASKLGLDVKPLHDYKGEILSDYIEILCDWLGFSKPEYLYPPSKHTNKEDFLKSYLGNIKVLFSSGLGQLGIGSMYANPDFTKGRPLALGGHVIGVLYQGHPFMFVSFALPSFLRKKRDKVKQRLRYLYTEEFIGSLGDASGDLAGLYEDLLPDTGFEYLCNMALSNKTPLHINKILPEELSSYEDAFRKSWVESLLRPILKNSYEALKENKLSVVEISQAMRVLRFATNVQSISLNTYNLNSAGLFNQQDPPLEGPMANFLMKRDVTLNEVKNPKHLEFMYFKKITGRDYFKNFMPQKLIKNILSRFSKKFYQGKKDLYNRRESMLSEAQFHSFVREFVKAESSVFLDGIPEGDIKNYIRGLYLKTEENPGWDFMIVNNLLNLEIFFNELRKA